jgi:hypothetical protein
MNAEAVNGQRLDALAAVVLHGDRRVARDRDRLPASPSSSTVRSASSWLPGSRVADGVVSRVTEASGCGVPAEVAAGTSVWVAAGSGSSPESLPQGKGERGGGGEHDEQ